MSDEQQPRNAREKLVRFAEENHNSLDLWCDPETGYFVDDWQAHLGDLLDAYAHELAERIRNVHGSGEGDAWNWWDAADIPGSCADLIDPLAADHSRSSAS